MRRFNFFQERLSQVIPAFARHLCHKHPKDERYALSFSDQPLMWYMRATEAALPGCLAPP